MIIIFVINKHLNNKISKMSNNQPIMIIWYKKTSMNN